MTPSPATSRIACFISSHGFGHAARTAAVLAAIHELNPSCAFDLFTITPESFFRDSLPCPYRYESLSVDVGLAQRSPLSEDLDKTLDRLDRFLPFAPRLTSSIAQTLRQNRVSLVLCDISPLGIAVATAAEIPSVLLHNFTWDWIYDGYDRYAAQLAPHIDYLRHWYRSATFRIRAEPAISTGHDDCVTAPISRNPRSDRLSVRTRLGVGNDVPMVLITLGGIPADTSFAELLRRQSRIQFLVPDGERTSVERSRNVIFLPHQGEFYHPDLIGASDAVVGKAGYSTIAEVYHSGLPFAYVLRRGFRETELLRQFIAENMCGIPLDGADFDKGAWIQRIPELIALPKSLPKPRIGAIQAAEFICGLLSREEQRK